MILNVAWFVGLLIFWDFPIQPIPGFTENDQREKISRLLQVHRNTIVKMSQNRHQIYGSGNGRSVCFLLNLTDSKSEGS